MKLLRIVPLALFSLFSVAVLAAEPKYDPSREVTLNGSATYVAEHPSHAPWTGVYTIMRESGGEIEVHLAPDAFLSNGGVELKSGDSIKVVGSRVRWKGAEIVLAREITVKGTTLQLREKDGAPRW